MKKKIAFFTLIAGLIITVAIFMMLNKGRQPLDLTSALAAEIVIEPTEFDQAGVSPSSQFLVKTSTYIDPKIVAENISVQPEIKFSLEEQEKANKIMLIPEKPLAADALYRFTLDLPGSQPLKWAFQTKGTFKINGTLPRDKSTGVPTNTGIEITFSHAGFEDIGKFFEISPQTKGRFENHKKTAVFVPDSLEPGTVYTVKVKKGLKLSDSDVALTEDLVFQFETQDPEQHNQNEAHLEFFADTIEFASAAVPVVPLGYYNAKDDGLPEVKVSLFKYADAASYMQSIREKEKVPYWAYFSRSEYLSETKGLEQVQSFSTKLRNYGRETFLEFPQALPAGYYLGEVTLGNVVRQVWLQISDLAVYTSVGEDKTLVWVHHLPDGKPGANAAITFLGRAGSYVTDEKGMAEVPTAQVEAQSGVYLAVRHQDKEAAAVVKPSRFGPMAGAGGENEQAAQNYWKYIYLDRGLYRPNDTVHFWGLVKGRDGVQETPRQLTVALTKWQDADQGNGVLEEKTVQVDANAFTGEMKLPDLIPGYYNLEVKVDGRTIARQGFDVQTYTKPAYRIDVTPEKKALFAGDTMNFDIGTTCFEETPVPNVTLKYNLDQSGEVTTDGKGQAVLSYTPEYRADGFGAVQYRYLYLNTILPESGEITSGTSVIVLNNDIQIEGAGEIKGKNGKIDIAVEKLTVDKVNSGEADPWEEDAFVSGKGSRIPVTVSVFRQEWDQVEDGEYYDYINKQVVKKYRYHERKVLVAKRSVVTNRNGEAHFDFVAEDKKSYWVELTAQDTKDNPAKSEIYLSGGVYPGEDDYSWYYLEDELAAGKKYGEGDPVLLTLKNSKGQVPERAESFLFYTAQRGIIGYQIQDTGTFEGTFSSQYIPNYWAKGVYFDGRMYHETPEYLVAFDEQEKALQVTVRTDKEEYRPQDRVRLNVEVRDRQGRPVAATVNLNLVDEALFALSPQQTDILGTLYGDFLPSGILMTGSTHKDPANYYGGGAEQGGEGGSERKDFKDTAFFRTITTGKDGKASVSFTVPDNLTAWRLTYQAVTKDLQGADGTVKIKVGLPFFADIILNDRYLAGDQPVMNLRALGAKLPEETEVTYRVKVTGEETVYNETLTGKAFALVPVSLPPLKEGDYQISVTATGNRLKDTVTRSFQVMKTYMTRENVDHDLLTAETKIAISTDKPVTLTFTDAERSQYLTALCVLANVEGSRVEQKLAPRIAETLLKEHFPEFAYLPDRPDVHLSPYQTPDGGIAVLPYGNSDLEVSAQIAPWSRDQFDLAALKAYFERVLQDPKESRERGIIALYGLASLGEPVLQEIELVVQERDLTVKEQLYVILAFNQLENEQPARKMLKQLLKKYGEANGPYIEMNTGSDKDDRTKITGLTTMAAGKLMFEERNKLHRYIMENQPKNDLIYLEQIAFLQEALSRLPQEEVSFSYSLAGKKQQVRLAPGETYALLVTPEKLNLLSFTDIKGSVGMTTGYQDTFDPAGTANLEDVSLKRDYQVQGKSTRQFETGDLVAVEISWEIGGKAPDGMYQITDYLPSGLKLVEKPYQWGAAQDYLGRPVEVEGQKVAFLVSGKGKLRYYARVVNQGFFTAQHMTLQHVQNGKIYSVTALDKVEIR